MKLAIIGAGAAGIFGSKFLKDWNGEIVLYEAANHAGKKLAITGGGRMNLTNKDLNVCHYFSSDERTLKHVFKSNFARNYLSLFDELGVKMKWENNRGILASEDAPGQVKAWEEELKKQKNLTLKLNTEVLDILVSNGKFLVKDNQGENHLFDFVLINSGGMLQEFKKQTEQKTYSTISPLGHHIISPTPCLSPIFIEKNPFTPLAGTAIEAEIKAGNHKVKDQLLFTHKGLSGPAVLDFSANWEGGDFLLNMLPKISEEDFGREFQELRTGKHKLIKLLQKYLPRRVAEFMSEQIGAGEKFIADINKDDAKKLRLLLFHWRIDNARKGSFEQSWTTRGGVDLREINAANMESKIVPNLFFAGEIVDVSGLCGGYNITWAAISARMVCEAILKK